MLINTNKKENTNKLKFGTVFDNIKNSSLKNKKS
jgi:hypothetical protein